MNSEANKQAGWANLSGQVTYRQRIALRPNALLRVELQDMSLADAPAVVLAAAESAPMGLNVPLPFILTYNADVIDDRRRYVLRATISYGGVLAWTSTTAHPVLTGGGPVDDVTIVVEQVTG